MVQSEDLSSSFSCCLLITEETCKTSEKSIPVAIIRPSRSNFWIDDRRIGSMDISQEIRYFSRHTLILIMTWFAINRTGTRK